MKTGTKVEMEVNNEWLTGVTIENESVVAGSTKRVIRVRWSDDSETIENVENLYAIK